MMERAKNCAGEDLLVMMAKTRWRRLRRSCGGYGEDLVVEMAKTWWYVCFFEWTVGQLIYYYVAFMFVYLFM